MRLDIYATLMVIASLITFSQACNLLDDKSSLNDNLQGLKPHKKVTDLCAGEQCSSTLYCTALLECISPDDDSHAVCTWPSWLTHTIIGLTLLALFAVGGMIHFVFEKIRYRLRLNQQKKKFLRVD